MPRARGLRAAEPGVFRPRCRWAAGRGRVAPESLRLGSPVVLRGLRCHVCCDSALEFRETLCWIAPTLYFPSFQTPRGTVWPGGEKKRQGRKLMLCVRAWRFGFVPLVLSELLIWLKCCWFSLLNGVRDTHLASVARHLLRKITLVIVFFVV